MFAARRSASRHNDFLAPSLSLSLALLCCVLFSCGSGRNPSSGGAKERGRLIVYSSHPAAMVAEIVKEFRQRTGIETVVVSAETGELISRLRDEVRDEARSAARGTAPENKGEADVFWGGGPESLDSLSDLFSSYRSDESGAIPAEYKDAEGRWTGFSLNTTVIIYNSRLVPPSEAPRAWRDLTRPFFRGRVAMADPRRSGSAYTALATMLRAIAVPASGTADGLPGSVESWAFVDSLLAAFDVETLPADSARVHGGVAAGEWFAGITFESAALSLKASGADLGIVYPAEGTSVVPDGVAIVSSGENRAAAEAFVDFVLGRDVQGVIAEEWMRRGVRSDLVSPAGILPLSSIPMVDYEGRSAGKEKERVLAEWSRRLSLITSRP